MIILKCFLILEIKANSIDMVKLLIPIVEHSIPLNHLQLFFLIVIINYQPLKYHHLI
jgi:hypothetical protein